MKNITIKPLYAVSILAYAIAAVAGAFVMKSVVVTLVTSFLTSNTLTSTTSTNFVAASLQIFNIDWRWLFTTLCILAIIMPASYLYIESKKTKKLQEKIRLIDRLDLIVLGTYVSLLIALLSGLEDLLSLIIFGALVVFGLLLCSVSSGGDEKKSDIKSITYVIGLVSIVLPWLLIIIYSIGTIAYGMVRSPWYVYALDVIGLAISAYGIFLGGEGVFIKRNTPQINKIAGLQILKLAAILVLLLGFLR